MKNLAIDYDMLPEHMRQGARLYMEEGIAGGSFLMALLANDVVTALNCSDDTNNQTLPEWAYWLQWQIPACSWGSVEAVQKWISHDGQKGPWREIHGRK